MAKDLQKATGMALPTIAGDADEDAAAADDAGEVVDEAGEEEPELTPVLPPDVSADLKRIENDLGKAHVLKFQPMQSVEVARPQCQIQRRRWLLASHYFNSTSPAEDFTAAMVQSERNEW